MFFLYSAQMMLPFITTSALQVQFGLRDLVVIGLSKIKLDFAKVDRVQNQQVDITYYKRRNLSLWTSDSEFQYY